jgi:hypothetical protein
MIDSWKEPFMDVQKNQQSPPKTVGENQADGTFDDKKKKKGEDLDEAVDDLNDPNEEDDDDDDDDDEEEDEEEEEDPDSDKDKA